MWNIPHSTCLPVVGCFYERRVRSVKTPLKKVIGTAKLTYEEMETALIEIEGIINTRPLTYLYDDDVAEPLTPSHLLSGRNLFATPEPESLVESSTATLSRRYKFLQTTLRSMWTKFRHHYLTELREHHMYTRRKTNSENVLKIGEVVIIKDDDVRSRCSWRLGRVESLVVGGDNQVRGANLRTISKEFRRTSMSRPLQKIIPLEVVDSPATLPSHPHSQILYRRHLLDLDEHVRRRVNYDDVRCNKYNDPCGTPYLQWVGEVIVI